MKHFRQAYFIDKCAIKKIDKMHIDVESPVQTTGIWVNTSGRTTIKAKRVSCCAIKDFIECISNNSLLRWILQEIILKAIQKHKY